ncbi:MAG: hypothetical protein Q8N17_08255 [Burkholderiaceae bacterium]|nr:hypothetical protein [Burkholderiaceae bacterium]
MICARSLAALALGLSLNLCLAQSAPPVQRLRGTVQSVTASTLVVKERRGEVIELALNDKVTVTETYPIALADIKPGSFIGTAAMPQADGTQRAIAVTVFPEASRGVGEGHRPFDLQERSTMTNATVADVLTATQGRTLQLRYQGGEKTVVVPMDAPIVTFRPGDRSLLVPGASVSLSAQMVDGKPTVLRVNAGKNGFVLPY